MKTDFLLCSLQVSSQWQSTYTNFKWKQVQVGMVSQKATKGRKNTICTVPTTCAIFPTMLHGACYVPKNVAVTFVSFHFQALSWMAGYKAGYNPSHRPGTEDEITDQQSLQSFWHTGVVALQRPFLWHLLVSTPCSLNPQLQEYAASDPVSRPL